MIFDLDQYCPLDGKKLSPSKMCQTLVPLQNCWHYFKYSKKEFILFIDPNIRLIFDIDLKINRLSIFDCSNSFNIKLDLEFSFVVNPEQLSNEYYYHLLMSKIKIMLAFQ